MPNSFPVHSNQHQKDLASIDRMTRSIARCKRIIAEHEAEIGALRGQERRQHERRYKLLVKTGLTVVAD